MHVVFNAYFEKEFVLIPIPIWFKYVGYVYILRILFFYNLIAVFTISSVFPTAYNYSFCFSLASLKFQLMQGSLLLLYSRYISWPRCPHWHFALLIFPLTATASPPRNVVVRSN